MAEARIDRLTTRSGPFEPGKTVTICRNLIYNTAPEDAQAQQHYKIGIIDANGDELENICNDWVNIDGGLRWGIRNVVGGEPDQLCDPEVGTQDLQMTVPSDVGSKFYMGFATWVADDQQQPDYPEPGTPEAREGNSRAWEVMTTEEEPVPMPGPNHGELEAAGLMLLAGISTVSATEYL